MLSTVDRNKIQLYLQLIAAEFNDVGRYQWHATLSTVDRNKIQCFLSRYNIAAQFNPIFSTGR